MFQPCRLLTFAILASACAQIGDANEAVLISSGSPPNQPMQPQLAVDASGAVHVVFGINNSVFYCQSNDGGHTFEKPTELPGKHVLSLGMRRGPRIAVSGDLICVSAIAGKQGKGRDGDLLAFHSSDLGKSWHGPVAVNDTPGAAREGLHAMACGPQGHVCNVWLDLRSGMTEIYAAISADGGKSWGKNIRVYRSPDGSVCECCHPSVAYDPSGKLHVMWRNSLSGSRDMYSASSADGGTTFGKAAKLGEGTWPLDACPMDGGAIVVTTPGKIATAWRRENAVFLLLDGQREERRLGAGEQPWIAATADGPVVVWLKKRGDAALLLSPGSNSPVELAAHANDPVIATGPNGRGPVVVVWETHEGKNRSIHCQVVTDAK